MLMAHQQSAGIDGVMRLSAHRSNGVCNVAVCANEKGRSSSSAGRYFLVGAAGLEPATLCLEDPTTIFLPSAAMCV